MATVIATSVSNWRCSRAVSVVRTAVGDKYVMEEMAARGLSLGGEQSGHVSSRTIFTGDGLCARSTSFDRRPLDGLADLSDLTAYPQVLLNVRVRGKPVEDRPAGCCGDGPSRSPACRPWPVVGGYSGTEPLVRVMLEGATKGDQRLEHEIVDVVRNTWGELLTVG